MNHQRSLAVTKSSRKTGIARTTDKRMATSHHVRNFSFQTYAEDHDYEQDTAPRSFSAYGRIHTPALRDKRLLEEVYEQVALQNHLDTRDLHLDVNDGVVVIKGSVSDHAMKAEIAKVVQQCSAVKTIINRIAAPCAQMPGE